MKQKVLFLGASGSGKTTALEHIKNEKNIDISSFDYGKANIGNNSAYLFSSPDMEGFKFIHEVLTDDIDGIIIFIDNTKGIRKTDREIIDLIYKNHFPHIIFANKQDLSSDILKIDFDTLIIPTIATEGIGINYGLNILHRLIENTINEHLKPERALKNKIKKRENTLKPDLINIIKSINQSNKMKINEADLCKLKLFLHPIELDNIKNALEDAGFSNITLIEVGYIDYHNITRESYRGSNYNIKMPPRMEINLIIKQEDIKYVVQAIKSIKTEDISDDIFIVPVEEAVRIRTEERGEEAVE